jgi:O-antigen/teichoic acid export membrane protein
VSKALGMAKASARSGFNVFWGLFISTVISAVGVIIVARLLSPSEYGIVTVALTAPNLIQIFRDWGLDTAMIRYTAHYRSEGKSTEAEHILITGLVFEIILGLALTILSVLLSGILAVNVFERPDTKSLIQIASLNIFAGALTTAAQSAFFGVERMDLNSVMMVVQSCVTTVSMTLLIILGLGTYGAIVGTTIAALITGLIGILIMLKLLKSPKKSNGDRLRIVEHMKTMFKYGLPLSLSAIIGGFLTQFYQFMIVIYATDLMIGNYSVATNFGVLVTFLSIPISTTLFPTFSKLDSQKDGKTLRDVFKFSVKYGAFLVVPAAAFIMTLSQPVVSTIFGEEYSYAPLFLAMLTISYLYSAFGSLSVGNLINSQGKTKVNLILTLVSSAIGLPLSLILIPQFGVAGLIVTSLIAGVPSMILGLRWVKTNFGVTVDWVSSAKILLSSGTAAVITYLVLSQLSLSSWMRLIVGGTIFLFVFIVANIAVRTMNKSDRNNIKEISKDLGPLHYLIDVLLKIILKMATVLQRR